MNTPLPTYIVKGKVYQDFWYNYLESRRPGLGKYLRDITRFSQQPFR